MIKFSDIVIDPDQYTLTVGDELIAVEPLVFDLIVLLSSHPNTLLSKDELLERVWGGRVVSDTTIASAIKNARKALGDSGQKQQYIKTVHGRGFQFVGNIDARLSGQENTNSAVLYDQPCLLILPFKNLSDNPTFQHGLDGLVIELERIFSRVPLLIISAEGAHIASSHVPASPRQIFEQTKATYLLEGSGHLQGDQLNLNVQLTDTRLGFRIASEQYSCDTASSDNPFGDLVIDVVRRFESKINRAIYDSILSTDGEHSSRSLYLQASGVLAQKGWHQNTFLEAAALLRQSISLDNDFAPAYAYLSLLLALGHRIGLLGEREKEIAESIEMAERALQLTAHDSSVLGHVGCAFCDMGNIERGIPLLKKAIDINSSNGQAWAALGAAYLMTHDAESAIKYLSHGVNISPLDSSLSVWRTLLAVGHMQAENFVQARADAELACQDDDKTYLPRVVLAASRLLTDDKAGAKNAMSEAIRTKPDLSDTQIDALVGPKVRFNLKKLV